MGIMKILVVLILINFAFGKNDDESISSKQQIITPKEKTKIPIDVMTTSAGAPIEYKDATSTLNSRLIFNEYFMDSMTHLVRERIPERVVHAKGAGAFGYFEVTHDITNICKADLFRTIGKKTSVVVRFSPVVEERGGIDTSRDSRGFAIKFYTKEGNFDIVGYSFPMYILRDPLLFPAFVRVQKKNPVTNLKDKNMLWDYMTLHPESLHMCLLYFADRAISDGYRHMPGFGVHTFQVTNENGDNHFIRFHFTPDHGIKNLNSEQARAIAAKDPEYATKDLYNAISKNYFPSWTVGIQVLTTDDVKTAGFDVFDVTKVLPLNKYPLQPVGRLVLNKNPVNYHAEIEQLAFSPANLVPGILGAPDKVFEARRLAYRDAQYYRLGANFNKISVNCPLHNKVLAYNRDGRFPEHDNGKDSPNYYPNSFNGPVPYTDPKNSTLIEIFQSDLNNFDQARDLYNNEMTKEEQNRLANNIVYSLEGVSNELQDKTIKLFSEINPELGLKISTQLYDIK